MSSKSKDMVKGIVKNAAPKSTFGTDPNDPWSAKAGVTENVTSRRSDLLKKFYKSKGYNIDYVSKNQRVGQAKTGEFDKWKADRGIYEQDEIGEGITYKPSSSKVKTSAGHQVVGHSWHSNGTKHANIVKHGETGKYFAAGGSSSHPVKSTTFHDSPEDAVKSKKSYVKEEEAVVETTAPISVKQIDELNKDTITSYANKAEKDQDKQFTTIGKGLRDNDPKSANKASHKFSMRSVGLNRAEKRLGEDAVAEGVGDPMAATQSPADGANGGEELATPKKSKAGKMVKEIYAKHRIKEDMYDHEKDDKGPGTYGKAPKVNKKVEVNDDDEKGVNARMVLKGGTTLTGSKRDTVEIDPMLKNRSKTPDYMSGDPKKQQQKPQ